MKIFIQDKGRYKRNTGYGNLSRNFGMALHLSGCEVFYESVDIGWDSEILSSKKDEFNRCFKLGKPSDADIALTISPPQARTIFNVPNVIYTQNGLNGLKNKWAQEIKLYDSVIVPGTFDVSDFKVYNKNTLSCPQLVDNNLFTERQRWREEGSDLFTFIFIGSLSYRKGVDLLLEAFCKFSKHDGNNSLLKLYCSGADNVNFVISAIRNLNPLARVELHIKDFSQEWMARHINRADCFISLSRGEGWCMPLFESLLCKKPCIIPDSTAMTEFSPSGSVIRVPVIRKKVSEVNNSFATGFLNGYCEDNISSYDVVMDEAVAAMTEIKENYMDYKYKTESSRRYVLKNYNYEKVGSMLKNNLSVVLHSKNQQNKF